MSFSSPFTAVTGATITAASHNTGYRDNINALWVYAGAGDIAYATGAADLTRLAIGAAYSRLRVNAGGTAPEWGGALPRVASTASSGTPTPNADTTDEYILTALAAAATFGAPSGTPKQGQKLIIRIKDNGTPRALGWNAAYRALGVALPTTTVTSKTLYVGFVYNETDAKWDCVAKSQEA